MHQPGSQLINTRQVHFQSLGSDPTLGIKVRSGSDLVTIVMWFFSHWLYLWHCGCWLAAEKPRFLTVSPLFLVSTSRAHSDTLSRARFASCLYPWCLFKFWLFNQSLVILVSMVVFAVPFTGSWVQFWAGPFLFTSPCFCVPACSVNWVAHELKSGDTVENWGFSAANQHPQCQWVKSMWTGLHHCSGECCGTY